MVVSDDTFAEDIIYVCHAMTSSYSRIITDKRLDGRVEIRKEYLPRILYIKCI